MTHLQGPRSSRHPPSREARLARLLVVLALLWVLLGSLFPYVFISPEESVRSVSDLWDLLSSDSFDRRDSIINVLFFVPFGFALATSCRRRAGGPLLAFFLVPMASIALSVSVEITQLFLPERVPSFLDILADSVGGVCGLLLGVLFGPRFIRMLFFLGDLGRRFVSVWTFRVCLLGYGTLVCLVSSSLEREITLENWDRGFPLLVGNERTGDRPWRGHVRGIELADRALSEGTVPRATAEGLSSVAGNSLVAVYDFTGGGFEDRAGNLPRFEWRGGSPGVRNEQGVKLAGFPWLQTNGTGSRWTEAVAETDQFTVLLRCATASLEQGNRARIFSFSSDPEHRNFAVVQEGARLIVRVRTPVTGKNGTLPELVIPGILESHHEQTVVITFDGSELAVYVDGARLPQALELSLGASLFSMVINLSAPAMTNYKLLFYGLAFLPLGGFLILSFPELRKQAVLRVTVLPGIWVVISYLFDAAMGAVGHRPLRGENVLLGAVFLGLPAVLWAVGSLGKSLQTGKFHSSRTAR